MSNKKNGNGILYFANGDKRVGVWKDDKLHGQATYYYSGGRIGDDNDDDNDNDNDNDNDRRGGVGGGQQAVGEAEEIMQPHRSCHSCHSSCHSCHTSGGNSSASLQHCKISHILYLNIVKPILLFIPT